MGSWGCPDGVMKRPQIGPHYGVCIEGMDGRYISSFIHHVAQLKDGEVVRTTTPDGPHYGPLLDPILDPLWDGTIYACTPYHPYIGLKPSTGCSAGTHYGT